MRSRIAGLEDVVLQQLNGSLLNLEITGICMSSLIYNGTDIEKWGAEPQFKKKEGLEPSLPPCATTTVNYRALLYLSTIISLCTIIHLLYALSVAKLNVKACM